MVASLRGKYRVGERLGGGGMAEVFSATLLGVEGFARPVAIKRVQPALSADASFGEMFINEARLASLLHHPNIAGVLDFDRDDDGSYFLVMELVQGCDVHRLARSGPVPPAVAAHIVCEVLRGLAYAHELVHQGKHLRIVHRDISPHNVMLSWDGGVKVVDFGIAKAVASTNASRSGSLKGKIGYMSPEQAHGDELDGRSDVFAVGVMFHELLTGKRLFQGATEPEILARLLNQPIPVPTEVNGSVPPDLAHVAMRMLERDRNRRFGSARQALEALLRCQSLSARASLDLQELMRARFPAEAPRRSAETPSVPRTTLPLREGASGAGAAPRTLTAGGSGPTPRTLTGSGSGATPMAAERARTVTRVGGKPMWVWIGAALAVSLASIATALVLTSGGNDKGETAAGPTPAEHAIDAGVEAPPIDATVAIAAPTQVVPDAAPAAAPPTVEARPKTKPRRSPPSRRPRPRPRATAKPPGKLRLVVDPWAKIRVDGRDRGTTPKTLSLSPGAHKVTLRNTELRRSETVTVDVVSGKTVTVKRTWE